MIKTVVVLTHDIDGLVKYEVFHPGSTNAEARQILWEALKNLTPGVQK